MSPHQATRLSPALHKLTILQPMYLKSLSDSTVWAHLFLQLLTYFNQCSITDIRGHHGGPRGYSDTSYNLVHSLLATLHKSFGRAVKQAFYPLGTPLVALTISDPLSHILNTIDPQRRPERNTLQCSVNACLQA